MITYNRVNNNSVKNELIKGANTNKGTYSHNKNINFNEILHKTVNKNAELKFSKHASERLDQRNIKLTMEELEKLNNALDNASQKGIKETLIIMEKKAFIANVKNKVIITAAVEEQLCENIFTNIDGAIII